jgi:hypothetical protein
VIAELAASPTRVGWSTVAEALAELRDATGPTAPPTVKALFGGSRDGGGKGGGDESVPSGLPEGNNPTLNRAVVCNEDTGLRDFDGAWAAYQQRLQLYPTTGRYSDYVPSCAGWPLPVQRVALRHSAGSLVLSGHRYETDSPYASTQAMQAAIGGTVLPSETTCPSPGSTRRDVCGTSSPTSRPVTRTATGARGTGAKVREYDPRLGSRS